METFERKDAAQNDQAGGNVGEENIALKLDDLNDYCLEGVFKYLSLADLMNVEDTNSRFVDEVPLQPDEYCEET